MSEVISAGELLREAGKFFDAADQPLREQARRAWQDGFNSAGRWMRAALMAMRKNFPENGDPNYSQLGWMKYGCATGAALIVVVISWRTASPWILLGVIPVFYVVEAQMVFLFPLAIDGFTSLADENRRWTKRAGGTWRVMLVVIPIAASMIFGGLLGRGFLRAWCVGCVAILIWYERLRLSAEQGLVRKRLEIGARQPLQVRLEKLPGFGHQFPARLLYASDLHCRGRNSLRAGEQLVQAARLERPDLILLGGDLVDNKSGLAQLVEIVSKLAAVAPVWAVAGNHDERSGLSDVVAAVSRGGGQWLGDRSVLLRLPGRNPFYLDGKNAGPDLQGGNRILCAHNPNIFSSAVAAGYKLVLAGHLHGGQFIFGESMGLIYPGAWFYRWNGRKFSAGGTTMFVSSGVNDTVPIRWNCPREIILCEIY